MRPFRFDRTWTFAVPPDELWRVLARTGEFRCWWPWLREFSGDGLVPGGRSACVVRAPVPYTLRFTVAVRELVPGRLLDAEVAGDLAGPARLTISPGDTPGLPGSPAGGDGNGAGSVARLAWEMELCRPMLRAAARFGRPVMEWGHDWVVTTGVEQFLTRALRVDDTHDSDSDTDPHRGPGTA